MGVITISTSSPASSTSSAFDAFVLHHLNHAHIRARLITNRVGFAKTALRQGWIDGEGALALVAEAGLLNFVTGPSS
jgi:hypothetical protein